MVSSTMLERKMDGIPERCLETKWRNVVMPKIFMRSFVLSLLVGISFALFACAPSTEGPSPSATLSATDQPTRQPAATPSPTDVPPTPTPLRPSISLENLWDLKPLYSIPDFGNGIRAVTFDPESRYFAAITGGNSQGTDHRLRVWSTETGLLVSESVEFGTDTWDLAVSPKGQIAVGLENGAVMIYSLPELDPIQSFSHAGAVNGVTFSPDGMYLAAGVAEVEGGMVYLWNVDEGVLVRRTWAHPYSVPGLAFSPNGQYLATGAVDRSVKVWQVSNGQLIRTLPQAGQGTSVQFSAGNVWLASAMCAQSTSDFRCVEGEVWIWGVEDWSLQQKLAGPVNWVEVIAFSQDASVIAGGGRDFGIYLWDRSNATLERSIPAHQGAVTALAISPDDRFIASGSTDGSVVLWSILP